MIRGDVRVNSFCLRDRIRRSQRAAVRLQEQVGELMVVQDRDRLAADQQSVLAMVTRAEGPPPARPNDPDQWA